MKLHGTGVFFNLNALKVLYLNKMISDRGGYPKKIKCKYLIFNDLDMCVCICVLIYPYPIGAKKTQKKSIKEAVLCFGSGLTDTKKVDNMILMRHSFQLIDFKEVMKAIFCMFFTGRILKYLSHLSLFYRPFRTPLSHLNLYMRLFSRFSFNGV